MNLPYGATVSTKMTVDGDRVIDTVSYPTVSGKTASVRYHLTPDGDRVPETGHTLDGDHHFPGEIYDY